MDGIRGLLTTGIHLGRPTRGVPEPPKDLGDCPTCGGWGRWGDDVECNTCRGSGNRPKDRED